MSGRLSDPVLVLGAFGFVGRHLVAEFERARRTVVSIDRRAFADDAQCGAALRRVLAGPARPGLVFHAAGVVGTDSESEMRAAHVDSTVDLLEAVAELAPGARVVVVGSAAELGAAAGGDSLAAECEEGSPQSAYGRSKMEQSRTARRLAVDRGIDLVRVRLFNTLGPLQSPALVGGAMVERLFHAWRGGRKEFEVRDAFSVRDYLDVRDVARCVFALAERLPRDPGRAPVNVCSGAGTTVAALAGELMASARLPVAARFVGTAAEATRIVGDPSTLRGVLGEEPVQRIAVWRSLAEMWDARVAASANEGKEEDSAAR